MTTQTIKPSMLDKLTPGNTNAGKTGSAKATDKEGLVVGNSASAAAGQGSANANSPAGSFVDTLNKKIAGKQDGVQQGGAEKSHKIGVSQLASQLQADASVSLNLGQAQPLAGNLKSGADKPTKQAKGVAAQLKAEARSAEGSDAPQEMAAAIGHPQVQMQSPKGGIRNPNDTDRTEGSTSGLVSVDVTTAAKGLTARRPASIPGTWVSEQSISDDRSSGTPSLAALKQPGTAFPGASLPQATNFVRESTAVSRPVQIQGNPNTLHVKGLTEPAQDPGAMKSALLQGVGEPGQRHAVDRTMTPAKTDGILPLSGPNRLQKGLSHSGQEPGVETKLQSAPEGHRGKSVDQLLVSNLENRPTGSGTEQKPQLINSQVQPAGHGNVLRDAGIVSQEKAVNQENADVSVAAAAQGRPVIPDITPGRSLNAQRVTKEAAKSAPAKSTHAPQLSGIVVPRVATSMASNEGPVTNSVDPAMPANAQLSPSENDLANPADVKSASPSSGVMTPKDTSSSVSGQILESIHSSLQQGQNRVTIALNPPELGRVFVRFEEQDNQVIGVLEVSQKQTRAEIEQALPQLLQNLQESGVQLKRLDVILNDQPDHGQPKDQSWNNSSGPYSEQQERHGDEGRGRAYDYDRPGSEGNSADMFEADDSTLVSNTAINMLA